jgi:hypothetical protein
MKKSTKNTTAAKKVVTVVKDAKLVVKAAKENAAKKKKAAPKVTSPIDWKNSVNGTAKKAKLKAGSLGVMRQFLIDNSEEFELDPIFMNILSISKKNKEVYGLLVESIPVNKQGTYSFHTMLRIIRRDLSKLQAKCAKLENARINKIIEAKKLPSRQEAAKLNAATVAA